MKKMLIKVTFIITLLGISCLIYKQDNQEEFFYEEKQVVQVCGEDVYLNDYLLGVIAGEMPASFEVEALKAQVVASRTYVYSRGLVVDDTTMSQVYLDQEKRKEKWGDNFDEYENKILEAIVSTEGEVLMDEGEYISALFFSSSNGYTESNENYFLGEPVDYLRSVESPYDISVVDIEKTCTYTTKQMEQYFQETILSFEILSYYDSGRVELVEVNGNEYSGREVRELLGLPSNDFSYKKEDDNHIFTCLGYGHGVGMSQYGAQGMAIEGYNYEEILLTYYTGVEIVKKEA